MNQKGFTLIELLVVVAIIGILAAVGVVAFQGFLKNSKTACVNNNHNLIYRIVMNEIKRCEINPTGGLLNLNGENLLNCSDIFTTTNNYGTVTSNLSNYFNNVLDNCFNSNIPASFPGRYQGNCVASGSQPEGWGGLNEQGVHHVAMGWERPNEVKFYLDSCVNPEGQASSKTYIIKF